MVPKLPDFGWEHPPVSKTNQALKKAITHLAACSLNSKHPYESGPEAFYKLALNGQHLGTDETPKELEMRPNRSCSTRD